MRKSNLLKDIQVLFSVLLTWGFYYVVQKYNLNFWLFPALVLFFALAYQYKYITLVGLVIGKAGKDLVSFVGIAIGNAKRDLTSLVGITIGNAERDLFSIVGIAIGNAEGDLVSFVGIAIGQCKKNEMRSTFGIIYENSTKTLIFYFLWLKIKTKLIE
ncbi:MAG: hypothetical protein U0469_00870 [Candidatus Paceibacterota bacterium]